MMITVDEAIETRECVLETANYPSIHIPIDTFCYWLTESAQEKGLPIRKIQLVHPDSPVITGFEAEGVQIEWVTAPDTDSLEKLNLYLDCSLKYGNTSTIFEMLDACQFIDFLIDNKLVDWSFKWQKNRKGGTATLTFQYQ